MDLLFATHFRNSDVGKEGAAPAAARRAMRVDWWVAARIITHRRVERPFDSFVPCKRPGMDGNFLALLHEVAQVWTGSSRPFYKGEGRSFFHKW